MESSEKRVAALYVIKNGPYFGINDVDPWDEARDARRYNGTLPVVAHPPCARWSSHFWHGCKPEGHPQRGKLGDDGGCFRAALKSVLLYGGILEHPCGTHAWKHFNLPEPIRGQQWQRVRDLDAWVVEVEQGHYGHKCEKKTWLFAVGPKPPDMILGSSNKTPPPGYKPCGEKRTNFNNLSARQRCATPPEFRDYLLDYARSVSAERNQTYYLSQHGILVLYKSKMEEKSNE